MPQSNSTVFITVPKFVTISTMPSNLPTLRPVPKEEKVVNSIIAVNDDLTPRGKKRRLDHLSWEEKIQRKKLKNRVAAQTSRDRKKARMEEMENEIKQLTDKTKLLENKCESLQTINDSLLEKNRKLDLEVQTLRQQLLCKSTEITTDVNISNSSFACVGGEPVSNGSAVSNFTDPLQQGSIFQMNLESTQAKLRKSNTLAALWRIVALCLLYKTCSTSMKNLMPENLKSWPKAYLPISQQTWRQVIKRAMSLLPKLQADQSDCLDQWWGPKQNAWNPANIAQNTQEIMT